MRRYRLVVVLTLVLIVAVAAAAFAVQRNTRPAAKPAPAQCPMMGMHAGMGPGMMGGGPGMMHGMMGGSSLAASDGAVYVLKGNTLYKYDSNLKLAGKVQIEAPAMSGRGGMHGGMMNSKATPTPDCANCPMAQK